jgi:hypothetical protein
LDECTAALGLGLSAPPAPIHPATENRLRHAAATLQSQLASIHASRQQAALVDLETRHIIEDDICSASFFRSTNKKSAPRVPITQLRDPSGTRHRTQHDLNRVADDYYGGPGGMFNLRAQREPAAERRLLHALIADNRVLPEHSRQRLQPSHFLTASNVSQALKGMNTGTAADSGGFTTEFFQRFGTRDHRETDEDGNESTSPNRLATLMAASFREALETRGPLFGGMNHAIMSLLYKDNGKALDELVNYRPITVCSILYKILSRTITVAINQELPYIIALDQCGFQHLKETGHCTHLTHEIANHCLHTDSTGVILFCDQSKAYDRVDWDFLHAVLNTMGFPEELRNLISLLYTDNVVQININGHLGKSIRPRNGLKQGDGLSCPLYLCAFQPFLSLIATDPDTYTGISIPHRCGPPR